MGSNVAFALRSILRKDLPKDFKVLDCSLCLISFILLYFILYFQYDICTYVFLSHSISSSLYS